MNPPMSAPTQPRNGQDVPPPAADQRVSPQLAPPPKMRRRPLIVVAAVAAICLGALLGVLAYTSVSSAREVVAVRANVDRGTEITRDDLITVRIGVDPALTTIPAAQIDELVGMRAERDLVAGGIVTPDQVTHDSVPAQGKTVVGLSLSPALVPADSLRTLAGVLMLSRYAFQLTTAVGTPVLLLGGTIIPLEMLPDWVSWIGQGITLSHLQRFLTSTATVPQWSALGWALALAVVYAAVGVWSVGVLLRRARKEASLELA
ncbi:SAF domain-containing protein [Propioniciclava sp.]|uniref:SAF domain-containing protein n=1 Tax=Propioniciclava sp. TaxID=2038686 RepID=UPI0026336964|nr:SAF domain-containing protein [Propioniciclava sp.]